jgi:hypothetical protein
MAKQGTGGKISVRLYMEGILIENGFVSLQCSSGRSQPASCQLELVPTNTIRHIMPGTWVHVFVTDPWEQTPNNDNSDYKLLFEGIVVSRGFTRMDDGRNFTVQCAGPEIFWTNAKQFWMNVGSSNGTWVDEMVVATSGGYGSFGKTGKTGTFGYAAKRIVFSKEGVEQAEEKFMDTLVTVLDDIGSVNPYYTNARNRFRITDRIIRAPAGKTEQLFQLALMGDLLDGLISRQSGQTNLVEMINQLLAPIMHEWVSILAPPYIETRIFDRDVFGNIKKNKREVNVEGPRGRTDVKLLDYEPAIDKVVASLMFKPHIYTIDPPSFNVLFPNMYDQMSYSENFLEEPTRLSMRPQMPSVLKGITTSALFQRPTEIEVWTALAWDPARRTDKERTPDAKFGDGSSQAPTFTEFDWTTNEERIRGIVYNFINLGPAPSTLTLTDPGKKQPDGTRAGGAPKYLQNVASYEYYKSKFMARQSTCQGPFNMRPVPGFPMVMLDDSQSNLNVLCYLDGIQHSIDASGSAMTGYTVSYSRILGEVDLNRPRFKKGLTPDGKLDFSLARKEDGSFDFETIFDGYNQPPVPEWFDESFRNTRDLDKLYQSWFGGEAGVLQGILFQDPTDGAVQKVVDALAEVFSEEVDADASLLEKFATSIGAAAKVLKDKKDEFEAVLEKNENIPITEAVDYLNGRYRAARGFGKEFEEASSFTKRRFTKIDEAFSFVGAAPRELADEISSDVSESDRIATFNTHPAATRVIDYKTARLDYFVGDTSAGSGFSGTTEGDKKSGAPESPDTPDAVGSAAAAFGTDTANRMSGAFPDFDNKIHDGDENTDQAKRDIAAIKESGPSDRARYDGRPFMFDFEFRLWQDSLKQAGQTPDGQKIIEDAEASDYVLFEDGKFVREKTAEEIKDAAKNRRINLDLQAERDKNAKKGGKGKPTPTGTKNLDPAQSAPTGADLELGKKQPLPQPLSEKQVIDLRRSVIEAWNEELRRTRGFTG